MYVQQYSIIQPPSLHIIPKKKYIDGFVLSKNEPFNFPYITFNKVLLFFCQSNLLRNTEKKKRKNLLLQASLFLTWIFHP